MGPLIINVYWLWHHHQSLFAQSAQYHHNENIIIKTFFFLTAEPLRVAHQF